jgi:hypothetical protein
MGLVEPQSGGSPGIGAALVSMPTTGNLPIYF